MELLHRLHWDLVARNTNNFQCQKPGSSVKWAKSPPIHEKLVFLPVLCTGYVLKYGHSSRRNQKRETNIGREKSKYKRDTCMGEGWLLKYSIDSIDGSCLTSEMATCQHRLGPTTFCLATPHVENIFSTSG